MLTVEVDRSRGAVAAEGLIGHRDRRDVRVLLFDRTVAGRIRRVVPRGVAVLRPACGPTARLLAGSNPKNSQPAQQLLR